EDVARAAVRVRVALARLEAADAARGRAGVPVVAAAEGGAGRLAAHDLRTLAVGLGGRPAAVRVLAADLARRAASARRLTDEDARGAERKARATATLASA